MLYELSVSNIINTFEDLNLSEQMQKSISELGYTTPSAIQAQALPILMGDNTDFLGLAATGTGKTAAFGIPLLEKMDAKKKVVQGLILCPTRELANQVAGQINLLGKYKSIKAVAVYGGSSFGDQAYALKNGSQVVVGTPGRVIDHITRGTLKLNSLQTFILDEADEMISMGFKEELEKILESVPKDDSQIWLFSATMSREVRRIADNYLRKPKQVQVNNKEMLSANVEQFYYVTQESNKPEILCKLIDAAEDFYGLVFCQTKALVSDLSQYLSSRGYHVDCLHGDIDQRSRERVMQAFRDRKVQMLICTDVAARGLDVKDVTHVINYSIPRELDSYVHRIGRTARSGKSGVAMSLVTPANRRLIERIEAMTKSRMQQGKIPSSKEVGMKKVNLMLPKFIDQKKFARASELLSAEWAEALTTMSPDEIAGRFLSMMLPDLVAEPEKNQFQRESFRDGDSRPQRQFDDQRGGGRGGGGGYRGSRGGGDYNRSAGSSGGGGGDRNRDRGGDRGAKPSWKSKKPDHKARS